MMERWKTFQVKASYDAETNVWHVSESDVPGLTAEATSENELTEKIRARIQDLLSLNSRQYILNIYFDAEEKLSAVMRYYQMWVACIRQNGIGDFPTVDPFQAKDFESALKIAKKILSDFEKDNPDFSYRIIGLCEYSKTALFDHEKPF